MTVSTSSSAARTDVREWITIRGARQNNLRGIDVQLPKNRVITVLGRSGSGKSSLVMDTIAAEAQRRLNATYPAFIQSLMGALPRPAVDSITGLGAAIVVDQAPIGTSARSTVGTFSETWTMLRALYNAEGSPQVRSVAELSFNDPEGMCPNCQGSGRATRVDLDAILDRSKSLNDGAIMFPNFAVGSLFWTVYAKSGLVDPDTAVQDYSEDQLRIFLYGTKSDVPKVNTGSYNLAYEGLMVKLERLYFSKEAATLKGHVRAAVEKSSVSGVCPDCQGSRLAPAARECTVSGLPFGDVQERTVTEMATWAVALPNTVPQALRTELERALRTIENIGLGYLKLGRPTTTLSRGEGQRLKIARVVSSPLTDAIYVFDEPTAGLHPAEHEAIFAICAALRDEGNTVILVEHSAVMAARSDWNVEIGPGSGAGGGTVVFEGPPQASSHSTSGARPPFPPDRTA